MIILLADGQIRKIHATLHLSCILVMTIVMLTKDLHEQLIFLQGSRTKEGSEHGQANGMN
jgi:hypothetical protein